MKPPIYHISLDAFWRDPYPDLKTMRAEAPVAFVPELGATLISRRDDIFALEKKIDFFSSNQPEGLMTQLIGQNMMRKDGDAHMSERRAIFPTVSPKTVKNLWMQDFENFTSTILERVLPLGEIDMVTLAKELSGEALRALTGLTNMTWQEMDRTSQGIIDGCANYAGDRAIEANCNDCTASIDAHIDARLAVLKDAPDSSLLSVQYQAGLSMDQIRANIKLAISGGQNEPRDVIAGMIWALLTHPDQLALLNSGQANWMDAFNEYTRWQSPIGMSPRQMAQDFEVHGITLKKDERVFFMFGSGNRDERNFARPDIFDLTQDSSKSIAFGAGPHFCAGAWASRALIADVVLPSVFRSLRNMRLNGNTEFGGWAFRGPLSVPVVWDT
ncbi:cytochrome P450 [Planktotalea sp.]|uniref:cytochrome P450 n=1 Tax=Planktotalea sp. TaxID=2029877 RepID=UPI003296AEFF